MLKFAIIGDPVAHSLSPLMHSSFYDYYRIDADYNAILVKPNDLKEFLQNLRDSDYLGINVTIPHKESVIPFLDAVSKEAQTIGAVNCILRRNGKLIGYNTDMSGFEASLPVSMYGEKTVIIGAGGAARSILTACINAGSQQIVIFNRTPEKAEKLRTEFSGKFPHTVLKAYALADPILKSELSQASLLINATSSGMEPDSDERLPLRPEDLHQGIFVYDVVYTPPTTDLIKIAIQAGVSYLNGLDMLIHQGLESLKIWLNHELPFQKSLIKRTKSELMSKLLDNNS
ncbi:shikimate dehydrogenase [candidate division KSB1 bacterium]|nr:shikimate dehydrogenase [candidate division KSB1 bacterium]